MRGLARAVAVAAVATACLLPAQAQAAFGFEELDMTIADPSGTPSLLAGSHPWAMTFSFTVSTKTDPGTGRTIPDEEAKDVVVELPPGLAGTPDAVPKCSIADFLAKPQGFGLNDCADASAIGTAEVSLEPGNFAPPSPVYLLEPSPGNVLKVGFIAATVPVVIDVGLNPASPHNGIARAANLPQPVFAFASVLTLWGVPADPGHDDDRGACEASGEGCSVDIPEKPFLTLPTGCEGPLKTHVRADSWLHPGAWVEYLLETHDASDPPNPLGLGACETLGFAPQTTARPSTDQAESPSGLDFELDVEDEGLTSASGSSQSVIKKAVVTLPAGVTINPSIAEGLATCSPAQLDRETVDSEPGEGCPEASKIGSVEAETPLLEGKLLKGSLFVATQDDPATPQPGAENPFDSLVALYMVIRDRDLGILIKLPARVAPNEEAGPNTGRLITTLGEPGYEIPQIAHISRFRLHLRGGGRSPLITPSHCGTYTTEALLTPWASPATPLRTSSSFQITRGVGGGPCPPGGLPPFAPGFSAGTINNSAGSYSPFYMRLTRRDGDQDMTKFSSVLPPGLTGKLAGIAKCPDSAIAAAKAKTGRQELASPSCPASSRIGRTAAGAGVGTELTYVPGSIYLGGPVGGDPLSVIAITPAVAGPFDAGTVVVREALAIDPLTAEVEVDGAHSDPIPHVLKGIVLKVRDLRVHADRPEFTLNPTSCDPSQVKATLFGSFANVFDPADDVPVSLADRFQAASCASLGLRPALDLRLHGGTSRGSHPSFRAVLTPRPGDANFERITATLPRSAFLDQAHIRTVCTRVQFAAHACPPGSVYGHATVSTPLLDEPLTGPVYLRSSNHKLPDLVLALHGLIDLDLVGRVDSHKGGIRTSFEAIPDAPSSKAVLVMQGGQKGLIVNSRNLCARSSRASVQVLGQNGRRIELAPPLRAQCKHKPARRKGRR